MINKEKLSYLKEFLPFFNELSKDELSKLLSISKVQSYSKGDLINSKYSASCSGIILVLDGQLRSFIHSTSGKEITIFRLLSRDFCLLSAACAFKDISCDVSIEVEKDSLALIINGTYFKKLSDSNTAVQKFLLDLTQDKFSEVMCLIEDIVFLSFDKRLSKFLMNESFLQDNTTITITHDTIANNLGSAREVVSRMLKKFELDNIIKIHRGKIEIIDRLKLYDLSK
ncbi:Crp/Fnr family transcriptional regulator [Clostridium sardiniense]|uniref:Crp/Fnr family transcriptional regulator n=1 Tax=Clostridium sardiniense TaxID=29369 RepID=UPI003D33C986